MPPIDDNTPAPEAPELDQQPAEAGSGDETVGPSSMLEALRGSLATDKGEADATPAAEENAQETRLRGPDGRFVAKDGTPTDDPAQAVQKPAIEKPAIEKPADDPYREPEGLKPEAKERFQSLVTMARESKQQLETVQAQHAEMQQTVTAFQRMIADSGATDQEFLALLDFTRAMKSGDWQAAEGLLAQQVQAFRMATGRDPAGSDPFAQHQDLAQAVQAGQITPEAARQVLQARQVLAQQQQMQQQQVRDQQAQQQFASAVQASSQRVKAMVEQWSRSDLDWPKKQALMAEHAKRIGETIPPEHWTAALQMAYDAVGQGMVSAAPPRAPIGPGTPQPLRPSAAAAGRKEPTNMLEAISGAIGQA